MRAIIIIIIIRLLRIKAAHNTLQYIKRSSSNKREEIKTNTTMKETNVQNKREKIKTHTTLKETNVLN